MTDKEFRRLSRAELVELLYEVQKQSDAKTAEIKSLRQQLDQKRITLEASGNIAEAALQLNKIFDTAQASADQYLFSIREKEAEMVAMRAKTEEDCKRMREEAERILSEAREKAGT